MEDQYKANWGYKEEEKRAEIFAKTSRYLVAVQVKEVEIALTETERSSDSTADGEDQHEDGEKLKVEEVPVGFIHLRFVFDEDGKPYLAPLLYLTPNVII